MGDLVERLRSRTLTTITSGHDVVEPDPDCQQAADALEAAERERDADRDKINELQAKLHCMCGSPMDHSPWEGHTPVSMYDHDRDTRLETAESALAEAREVVRPFAEAAEHVHADDPDDETFYDPIATCGEIRRARAWLSQRGGGDE